MRQWSNPKPDDFITCNDANLQRRRNTSLIILTHTTVKKMDGNLFVTGRSRRLPVVVITGTPSIFDRFRLGSPFGRQPVSRLAPTAVMFTNNLGHAVVSSHCFPLFCFHEVKILLRHVVDNKTHKKWRVAPKSTGVKRKARGPESARRSLQEFYF